MVGIVVTISPSLNYQKSLNQKGNEEARPTEGQMWKVSVIPSACTISLSSQQHRVQPLVRIRQKISGYLNGKAPWESFFQISRSDTALPSLRQIPSAGMQNSQQQMNKPQAMIWSDFMVDDQDTIKTDSIISLPILLFEKHVNSADCPSWIIRLGLSSTILSRQWNSLARKREGAFALIIISASLKRLGLSSPAFSGRGLSRSSVLCPLNPWDRRTFKDSRWLWVVWLSRGPPGHPIK